MGQDMVLLFHPDIVVFEIITHSAKTLYRVFDSQHINKYQRLFGKTPTDNHRIYTCRHAYTLTCLNFHYWFTFNHTLLTSQVGTTNHDKTTCKRDDEIWKINHKLHFTIQYLFRGSGVSTNKCGVGIEYHIFIGTLKCIHIINLFHCMR